MGLKNTGLSHQPALAYAADNILVQLTGKRRRRGLVKSGAPAFPAVSVQSELRNQQNRPASLQNTPVHAALPVGKNAQMDKLGAKIIRVTG
jgi:hypothetical protein